MARRCALSLPRVLFLGGVVCIILACLYLSSSNVTEYLSSNTYFVAKRSEDGLYKWPRIIICPTFPFNPMKLMKFLDKSLFENVSSSYFVSSIRNWKGFLNGTSLHTIDEAVWRVGEIVYSVDIGDQKILYSSSDEEQEYWSQIFIYPSVCYLLTPPPTTSTNVTLKIAFRSDRMYELLENCTSFCFLEHFKEIINLYGVSRVMYLQHISESYDIQPFPPMRHLYTSITMVEYYAKKVLEKTGKDANDCVEQCMSLNKDLNCTILNSYTLDVPVSSLCPRGLNDKVESYKQLCQKECLTADTDSYWRILPGSTDEKYDKDISITLMNNNLLTLVEIETYPLVKLLSEIGGNTGLFVGLSLMACLKIIVDYTFAYFKQSKMSHFHRILLRAFQICILLVMMKNLSSVITASDNNAPFEILAFKSKLCQKNHECFTNSSATNWLKTIFARPSIGCQPQTETKRDLCISSCVYKEVSIKLPVVHQWLLINLSNCSYKDLDRVTSAKIFLDNNLLDTQQTHEITNACSYACKNLSIAAKENSISFYPVIKEVRRFSTTDMICLVSGLFGLYFGCSLLDLQNLRFNILIKSFNEYSQHLKVLARLMYAMVLFYFMILLISQQIYTYFQKTMRYRQSTVIQGSKFPILTTCPIMFKHIKEGNGTINSGREVNSSHIFTAVTGMKCRNHYSFHGALTSSLVDLEPGSCISCIPQIDSFRSTRLPRLCSYVYFDSDFREDVNILSMLHMKGETPVWDDSDLLKGDSMFRNIFIDSVTNYAPVGSATETHGKCYSRCLRRVISNNGLELNRLAYLYTSNFSQWKDECETKCEGHLYTFFSGTGENSKNSFNKTYVSVNSKGFVKIVTRCKECTRGLSTCVTYKFQSIQKIEEVSSYKTSQLISDICSAIGISFGVSCLTLWSKFYHIITSKRTGITPQI